jgi:hypothetical protein
MPVVFPAESDPLSIESQQPVVDDCDTMCVAAKIAEHLGGSAEGRFGVYDPLLLEEGIDESGEPVRPREFG